MVKIYKFVLHCKVTLVALNGHEIEYGRYPSLSAKNNAAATNKAQQLNFLLKFIWTIRECIQHTKSYCQADPVN